jgi:hypothetical protein
MLPPKPNLFDFKLVVAGGRPDTAALAGYVLERQAHTNVIGRKSRPLHGQATAASVYINCKLARLEGDVSETYIKYSQDD